MDIRVSSKSGEVNYGDDTTVIGIPIKFELSRNEGRSIRAISVRDDFIEITYRESGEKNKLRVQTPQVEFLGETEDRKGWVEISSRPIVLHRRDGDGCNILQLLIIVDPAPREKLSDGQIHVPLKIGFGDADPIPVDCVANLMIEGSYVEVENIKRKDPPLVPVVNLLLLLVLSTLLLSWGFLMDGVTEASWAPSILTTFVGTVFGFFGLMSYRKSVDSFSKAHNLLSLTNYPELRLDHASFTILSSKLVLLIISTLCILVVFGFHISDYVTISQGPNEDLVFVDKNDNILNSGTRLMTLNSYDYEVKCIPDDTTHVEEAPTLGVLKPKKCDLLDLNCGLVYPNPENVRSDTFIVRAFTNTQTVEAYERINGIDILDWDATQFLTYTDNNKSLSRDVHLEMCGGEEENDTYDIEIHPDEKYIDIDFDLEENRKFARIRFEKIYKSILSKTDSPDTITPSKLNSLLHDEINKHMPTEDGYVPYESFSRILNPVIRNAIAVGREEGPKKVFKAELLIHVMAARGKNIDPDEIIADLRDDFQKLHNGRMATYGSRRPTALFHVFLQIANKYPSIEADINREVTNLLKSTRDISRPKIKTNLDSLRNRLGMSNN